MGNFAGTKSGEPMRYLLAMLTTMPTECPTAWPYARDTSGYPKIRNRRVHQIVCEWYHGPCPPGLECCHSCGMGKLGCFVPGHLRWDTRALNDADGRPFARGERHPKAVMTWAKVDAMRSRFAAGDATKAALAREYGISVETAYQILGGVTWKH